MLGRFTRSRGLLSIAIVALACQEFYLWLELGRHRIEDVRTFAVPASFHKMPQVDAITRLDELRRVPVPHGAFHLGPHSHSVAIPGSETVTPSWTAAQRRLLDDEGIDADVERRRCAAYGYGLPAVVPRRRRLFLGALIADDAFEVLRAVGTEAYNVFHTVAFVESNSTQNLTPRPWRFLGEDGRPSVARLNLHLLYQLFGPKTKVSVDYYTTSRTEADNEMLHERLQREGINHRWRKNGMTSRDVAVMQDADETFTRDFLRALQVCDVPRLIKRKSGCKRPKIVSSSVVMESSSDCVIRGRRWYHPDAILGTCVDLVGNVTLHPPTKRRWGDRDNPSSQHGTRLKGYGKDGDFSSYHQKHANKYPLWTADDIRAAVGGPQITKEDASPTGYHFDNFFSSAQEIHFKYSSYGHTVREALCRPIWTLNKDLDLGTRCAKGKNITGDIEKFGTLNPGPIYYLNEEARRKRHLAWQNIVREEEEKYSPYLLNWADSISTYSPTGLDHKSPTCSPWPGSLTIDE